VLPVDQQASYENFLTNVFFGNNSDECSLPTIWTKNSNLYIYAPSKKWNDSYFLSLFSQRKFDVSAVRFPGTGGKEGGLQEL